MLGLRIAEDVLTLRGAQLPCRHFGSGAPLLMLHGGAGPASRAPYLDALAEHFKITLPTHPWFYGSPPLARVAWVDDLAYLYLDLIEDAGLDHLTVLGFSMGGGPSRACRHPADSAPGRLGTVGPSAAGGQLACAISGELNSDGVARPYHDLSVVGRAPSLGRTHERGHRCGGPSSALDGGHHSSSRQAPIHRTYLDFSHWFYLNTLVVLLSAIVATHTTSVFPLREGLGYARRRSIHDARV